MDWAPELSAIRPELCSDWANATRDEIRQSALSMIDECLDARFGQQEKSKPVTQSRVSARLRQFKRDVEAQWGRMLDARWQGS